MGIRSSRRVLVAVVFAAVLTLTAVPLASSAGAVEPAPICPAAEGNARFVRWIYLQILFRCPDSGGAAFWTGQLDAGLGRGDMALTVDMSDENIINNNVIPTYQHFGRMPTPQESAYAAATIRAQRSDTQLLAELQAGDEFYNGAVQVPPNETRDQAWLTLVYNNILDRNPDSIGAAYFSGVLGSPSTVATRLKVTIALEYSPENAEGWVGAVYGAAFQRAPDGAGMDYWKNFLLTQGFQAFRMWTFFLSSDEAYAIAQTQPNPPPQTGPQSTTSRLRPAG